MVGTLPGVSPIATQKRKNGFPQIKYKPSSFESLHFVKKMCVIVTFAGFACGEQGIQKSRFWKILN